METEIRQQWPAGDGVWFSALLSGCDGRGALGDFQEVGSGLEGCRGQAERSGDEFQEGRVGHCRIGCFLGLVVEVRNTPWGN